MDQITQAKAILSQHARADVALAQAVLKGATETAHSLATAIMVINDHETKENAQRETDNEEYEAKRDSARAARKAAIDTWTPVLAPMFRKAGRHIGNNGSRWQNAMKAAGLNTRGATYGGCDTADIVKELVAHALGIRNFISFNEMTMPHDPDMKRVAEMCRAIARTPNARGQTGEVAE